MLSRLVKEESAAPHSSLARQQPSHTAPPRSAPASSTAVHRIRRDIEHIQQSITSGQLPEATQLLFDPRNPYVLEVVLVHRHSAEEGRHSSSPWEGLELPFRLTFTERYPFDGPRVRYVGSHRLLHPNIECGTGAAAGASPDAMREEDAEKQQTGGWGVCLGIQVHWRPTHTLVDLLLGLSVLVDHPNFTDPLPGQARLAAGLWSRHPAVFMALAREWIAGRYEGHSFPSQLLE